MSTKKLKVIVIETILYEQNEATLHGLGNVLSAHDSDAVLAPEQKVSIEQEIVGDEDRRFVLDEDLGDSGS